MKNAKLKIENGNASEGEDCVASGTEDGTVDSEGQERGVATAEEVLGKKTRRARSDTAVRGLTPEQRARVDGWLFDEQLSHAEVSERCQSELGIGAMVPGYLGLRCQKVKPELHRLRNSGRADSAQRVRIGLRPYSSDWIGRGTCVGARKGAFYEN